MPVGTLIQFVLPRWLIVAIARAAGSVAWRFNHSKRRRIEENLTHILGRSAPAGQIEAAGRRVFRNLAVNYADLLRTPVLRRRIAQLVDFDTVDLDRTMGAGRGVILVTAHIGNWDLAGALLASRGYPTSAVVEPIPRGWTRTFNRYRSITSMEAIPIPDRRGVVRAIRRGRLLALVSDRDLTGRGLLCAAFDAARSYPRGPAAYALRFGVPVVLGYLVFQPGPGRRPYRGVIEPLAPADACATDVDGLTQLIASRLNEIIATYPDQWLVFNAGWQSRQD
jgi:KDO2-lipid IV(A) lauroyltransferase